MRVSRIVAVSIVVSLIAGSAGAEGLNNLVAGANGIFTAPADPVMAAVSPPEEFGELWGSPVTGHSVGFFAGVFQMVHRLGLGVCDVIFSPFWVFPTLSPQARYEIFPYETEYEY